MHGTAIPYFFDTEVSLCDAVVLTQFLWSLVFAVKKDNVKV